MHPTKLILATLLILGGQTCTYAQFGKAIPADETRIPLMPQAIGPKDAAPQDVKDEFGLAPPTSAQVFSANSEQTVKEQLRRDLPNVKNVDFPKDAALPPDVPGTGLPPFPVQIANPVVNQVCYRPLYFEDKHTERFGYYVPYAQPLISTGIFYGDVLILPYRMWTAPPWTFQCDNR
jgi:hypothetical protein